ncbi:MAG TPA: hypothetical protein VNM45_15775 [Bacillus sp. (in: firmicutes)]|nr:hypothetical protein [Bacillus sp. (in: firmicutes)]
MNCCCESGETNELKIEGDVGADPIWCNRCGCNLDIEDVPISNELADELSSWAMKYGEWIDWNIDKLLPNGVKMEDEFNKIGFDLTRKVKQELEGNYKVKYSPSTSARFYAQGGL